MDIKEADGLWCDDITFCQEECERMDCPRNKVHIRDRNRPHSFSVDIPKDCLLKEQQSEEVSIKKRMRICRIMFNRCYTEHGNFICPYCEFRLVCEKERDHDIKRNS